MPDFIYDRRDTDFLLHEQFPVTELFAMERYKDLDVDVVRGVLDGLVAITKDVLAPTALDSEKGCQLENGEVKVPSSFKSAFEAYAEGGWVALSRPTTYGGMGLPLQIAAVKTELGIGAAASFFFFPALSTAAGHLLEEFASEELRSMICTKFYSGQWTGTMCLTEPQAGTSVGDLATKATPVDGTDHYIIQGNKIFITCADHDLAENVVHLVLARVAGDPAGTKGISLFAVPKIRWDADGKLLERNDVQVTALEEKMGIHGSPTCQVSFGDNEQCEGYLIGERCQGLVYMFQMMNEARIACGIQGVAASNYAYQLALAYARDRVQGAKVTDRSADAKGVSIIEHPDVRRNLMFCKSMSEGLRALLMEAAHFADLSQNHPDPGEAERYRDLVDLLTPICKAYATDQGFRVTEVAMQIHGGYGYCSEYGVEQLMRDVKIASIYEGTNGIQALDLLGRKMRLKDGALFMTWMQLANTFIEENKGHERLGDLVEAVDGAKNSLAQVAMNFAAQGKEDPELALLGATPFLEMFGHVEVARLLVAQAVIADTKLQEILGEDAQDPAAVAKHANDREDVKFYAGKLSSARFFVHTTLPHARALAKSIMAGDRSALDAVL